MLLETPKAAENLQVLASGRFKTQRGGRLISYAESIDDQGVMHNVFVAERDYDEPQMTVTLAESGEIIIDPETGRRYLELRNGSRHHGRPGATDYEVVTFAEFGELIPEEEGSVRSTPRIESVPTKELLNRPDSKAKAALWWRVSLPLLVPIVAIIAVALSKTDARRGRYARIGPALLIFLFYFIALTQGRRLYGSRRGGLAHRYNPLDICLSGRSSSFLGRPLKPLAGAPPWVNCNATLAASCLLRCWVC